MTPSDDDGRLDAYDFELPPELIAQTPAERRDASRLLVLDRKTGVVEHRGFPDVTDYLEPGDLLVVNDTRVVPARAHGTREATDGRVDALFLSHGRDAETIDALLGTRGRLVAGETLAFFDGALRVRLAARGERGRWTLRVVDGDLAALLEAHGRMPLPPYIKRERGPDARDDLDRERYQTVFAATPGAVAAPTAGLHFTPELMQRLGESGTDVARVTLHVGVGTFQPIETDDLAEHVMHEEWFEVPEATAAAHARARAAGRRVVAVGTTSVRSLESAWRDGALRHGAATTRLFIRPPAELRAVDALITNFHLPKSSLMLLVSAFAGRDRILAAYAEAIRERYRFFSYGDAMLIA